jgi:hypothetical protein
MGKVFGLEVAANQALSSTTIIHGKGSVVLLLPSSMCDSQKLIVANLSLDMFTMIGFAIFGGAILPVTVEEANDL